MELRPAILSFFFMALRGCTHAQFNVPTSAYAPPYTYHTTVSASSTTGSATTSGLATVAGETAIVFCEDDNEGSPSIIDFFEASSDASSVVNSTTISSNNNVFYMFLVPHVSASSAQTFGCSSHTGLGLNMQISAQLFYHAADGVTPAVYGDAIISTGSTSSATFTAPNILTLSVACASQVDVFGNQVSSTFTAGNVHNASVTWSMTVISQGYIGCEMLETSQPAVSLSGTFNSNNADSWAGIVVSLTG